MKYIELCKEPNDNGIYIDVNGNPGVLEKAKLIEESERVKGKNYLPVSPIIQKFIDNLKAHPECVNAWIDSDVSEKKNDSLWYGGLVMDWEVKKGNVSYHFEIRAIGDVIGYIYFKGEEIRIKDKGNNAVFPYELACLDIHDQDHVEFHDDIEEAEEASKNDTTKAHVWLDNNNWFECWVCKAEDGDYENGEFISDGWDVVYDLDECVDVGGWLEMVDESED